MTQSKQKKLTHTFFKKSAQEWFERTYDPKEHFAKFPSNKMRMEVVLGEMERRRIKGRMLDIGCGTGELVIELLERGNAIQGIDSTPEMIDRAQENLKKAKSKSNASEVFRVMDLGRFSVPEKKFDAVIALGLLEYLEEDKELFSLLGKIMKKGAYAFIDCRNKLFSIFSANDYTAKLAEKKQFAGLLNELTGIERFSPVSAHDIPRVETEVAKNVASFLRQIHGRKEWWKKEMPVFQKYPKGMVRRQHTPRDIERSAKRFGLVVDHIVYWHAHPYPPRYEKEFPRIYNKISYLTNPLGRTSLGAWMCSSFVAILRKK